MSNSQTSTHSALTTATGATYFGQQSQASSLTTSISDTAIGDQAQRFVTTGNNDTAVGQMAQRNMTARNANTAVGQTAQYGATTGSESTAVGALAGFAATAGTGHTFIGRGAGYAPGGVIADAVTTASYVTAVGHDFGGKTIDSYATTLGASTVASGYGSTALGAGAVAAGLGSVVTGRDPAGTGASKCPGRTCGWYCYALIQDRGLRKPRYLTQPCIQRGRTRRNQRSCGGRQLLLRQNNQQGKSAGLRPRSKQLRTETMPTVTAIMLLQADMQCQAEQYKIHIQDLQARLQTKDGELVALREAPGGAAG